MLNQKEWLAYFKAAHNRDPEPQEFSEALSRNEFTIEKMENLNQGPQSPLMEEKKKQVKQFIQDNSTDARSMKKAIQKIEDRLLAHFAQLGLQAYMQEINRTDESFGEKVDEIIEVNKVLYNLKSQYNQQVQRGRLCLSCGQRLGDKDRFCSNCGSDSEVLEKAALENVQICPLCKVQQDLSHHSCACCGLNL